MFSVKCYVSVRIVTSKYIANRRTVHTWTSLSLRDHDCSSTWYAFHPCVSKNEQLAHHAPLQYGTFGPAADKLPGCEGAHAGSCYGNWIVYTREKFNNAPSRFLSYFHEPDGADRWSQLVEDAS